MEEQDSVCELNAFQLRKLKLESPSEPVPASIGMSGCHNIQQEP